MPTETIKPNATLLYATLDRVIAEDQRGGWAQDTWSNWESEPDVDDWRHTDDPDVAAEYEKQQQRANLRQEATGDMCGTTACFAGWALVTAGASLVAVHSDGSHHTFIVMPGEDPVGDIASRAQALLGLSVYQRSELFAATRTLTDLKQTVDAIVAGDL